VTQKSDRGFICGRFQVPHIEHIEYAKLAKERCDFLWIGIVQPNIRHLVKSASDAPSAEHRSKALENPLTYFERQEILTAMCRGMGWRADEFACVPFPLDEAALLNDFIPAGTRCYTTICDAWNKDKQKILEAAGYPVEILLTRPQSRIQGAAIRKLIASGDPSWIALVPPETREYVERWNIAERLRHIASGTRD
jgi:nicotinamide mononucleotide adenylyltransferase